MSLKALQRDRTLMLFFPHRNKSALTESARCHVQMQPPLVTCCKHCGDQFEMHDVLLYPRAGQWYLRVILSRDGILELLLSISISVLRCIWKMYVYLNSEILLWCNECIAILRRTRVSRYGYLRCGYLEGEKEKNFVFLKSIRDAPPGFS